MLRRSPPVKMCYLPDASEQGTPLPDGASATFNTKHIIVQSQVPNSALARVAEAQSDGIVMVVTAEGVKAFADVAP